ncbi:MAG: SIS domain-containing protein [Oligoflexia bacterium]|nr:SIS domain-containing protein [Oligoflexia bacterium]
MPSKSGVAKKIKAISLADNIARITAISNDYGYEYIFETQLAEQSQPEDIVVLISASGNSKNLINAAYYAKSDGLFSVGVVGLDGGKLKEICDHVIHVQTIKGEYGVVEDIHLMFDHLVSEYLINIFKNRER